jgi:geranylgeranyl diphosphate synthase type II
MYNQLQLKDLTEKAIANLSLNTEAEKLIDPVKYVLSIGGKRLRPVLALMACNLFSDKIDEAVIPAAGLEVFHNFTLVHDDIMDQAPLRRNLPTVHSKWNLNQAVLSGDVMAFIANECFLQAPQRCMAEVFRIYNRAAIEVCVGQQLDMDFEKAAAVSQDEYLRMIGLKTAALLAASAMIGAVIGGAGEKDAALMYDFGWNLGLAFQIQDDLLDVYGDSRVFGKKPGGDIEANKKTFLFVKAMELASGEHQKRLLELFSKKSIDTEVKVKSVVGIYNELNVKKITEGIADDHINLAISTLERTVVAKERKKELLQLAETLAGREK